MYSISLPSFQTLPGRIAAAGAALVLLVGGVAAHAQQAQQVQHAQQAPMVVNGQTLKTPPLRQADLRPLLDELHDAAAGKGRRQLLLSAEYPKRLAAAQAAVREFGDTLKANHEEEAFRQYAMSLARENGQTTLLARLEQPGSVTALLEDTERDLNVAANELRRSRPLTDFLWQLAGIGSAEAQVGSWWCSIGCLVMPENWCAEHCGY